MIARTFLLTLLLTVVAPAQAEKPVLALVIDDLGYSFEQAKKVLQLPGNHTYAVIPQTTYSKKIAQYAGELGREVILHMPMQSATDLVIESSALHDGMDEHEITSRVADLISDLPNIRGINNHMGSRLTEIGYIMRPVMETIKQAQRPLYFLDSRTTPLSKAYQAALRAGLQSTKRDVFLDYDQHNPESMEFQWQRWLTKSKEKGHAIAIAHPYQTTIDFLNQKLRSADADDFRFATVSELLTKQPIEEVPAWPRYLSHWQKDSKNSKQ